MVCLRRVQSWSQRPDAWWQRKQGLLVAFVVFAGEQFVGLCDERGPVKPWGVAKLGDEVVVCFLTAAEVQSPLAANHDRTRWQ